jgi:hypothetical protein
LRIDHGRSPSLRSRSCFSSRSESGVGLARGERRRQLAVDRLGLQEELALGGLPVPGLDGEAALDVADHDLVEEAARLARVARHVRQAALVRVELLEGGDRQVEVVLLEAEQARRVVHQHVGVEHEQLLHFGLARRAGLGHGGGIRSRFCGEAFDIIGL